MIQARRRILKCAASARVIRVDPDWFFVCFSNEARRQKVGRAGFKALGRAPPRGIADFLRLNRTEVRDAHRMSRLQGGLKLRTDGALTVLDLRELAYE